MTTTIPRPKTAKVNLDGIPTELRARHQWVAWRFVQREGKWTKLPINPDTGRPASVNDPTAWSSCDQAFSLVLKGKTDGIGFVLKGDEGYVILDVDDCLDRLTGDIQPWAESIMQEVQSYTEKSPSQTGLRIVARGEIPGLQGRKKGGFEMYSQGRFLSFTGKRLGGMPTAIEDRQEVLLGLYERIFSKDEEQRSLPEVNPETGLSDDEIIARASKANGEKFDKLMRGDTSSYPSPSEADQALMAILAYWTGRDAARMESLFNRSALARRKKWKRPDYRKRTIDKAIRPTLTRRTKDNQEIQDIQGKPRVDTPHCCARKMTSEGTDQQGQDMGVREALDLAKHQVKAPCGRAAFDLARRLRRLSEADPEQFEQAVRAFCKETGHDYEECWYAFLAGWKKVKLKEGDDILTWAYHKAKAEPHTPSPCPGGPKGKYALVATIAHYLAERTRPQPFLLPCKRLASLLETSPMTVSNIITLLKQNNVVKCVDEDYKFSKRKAKTYVLCNNS